MTRAHVPRQDLFARFDTDGSGTSIMEMGYRSKPFHRIMERAEASFRTLLNVPDTHEVHFFNGGATLQVSRPPG